MLLCIVYDYNKQVRLVTKIREDKKIYFLMPCTQGLVTQSAEPDTHDVAVWQDKKKKKKRYSVFVQYVGQV